MSAETPTPESIIGISFEAYGALRTIKSEVRSPLFTLLTQIDAAVNQGMDLLAVSMAVALPDICGALQSDDGKACPERYREWCRDNLKNGFDNFSSEDLYSMRCGMLHQGRLRGLKHGIKQVVFMCGASSFTDCVDGGETYIYSTKTFCLNMNRAVVAWYEANAEHPNIQKNMNDLMQYRRAAFGVQGDLIA